MSKYQGRLESILNKSPSSDKERSNLRHNMQKIRANLNSKFIFRVIISILQKVLGDPIVGIPKFKNLVFCTKKSRLKITQFFTADESKKKHFSLSKQGVHTN